MHLLLLPCVERKHRVNCDETTKLSYMTLRFCTVILVERKKVVQFIWLIHAITINYGFTPTPMENSIIPLLVNRSSGILGIWDLMCATFYFYYTTFCYPFSLLNSLGNITWFVSTYNSSRNFNSTNNMIYSCLLWFATFSAVLCIFYSKYNNLSNCIPILYVV